MNSLQHPCACHGFTETRQLNFVTVSGRQIAFRFFVNITCPFVLLLASRFPRDEQYTILGSVHESGHAMFVEVVTLNDLVSTCVINL